MRLTRQTRLSKQIGYAIPLTGMAYFLEEAMQIPLSKRLQACCGFVVPGERVADIGCDHGYLGISLLKENIASFVIASDIREKPLESAIRNAERFGVKEKMAFYLSDGVQSIPREFDSLVCAGMGGDTMVSILEKAPWLKDGKYRLILQCQTRVHTLRRYLSDNGWRICKERLVRDGHFLYTVMSVRFEPGQPLTPAQCYFPLALLGNSGQELEEYYRFVVQGLKNTGKHQDNSVELDALYRIGKELGFSNDEG